VETEILFVLNTTTMPVWQRNRAECTFKKLHSLSPCVNQIKEKNVKNMQAKKKGLYNINSLQTHNSS
jgi:hypothetical protein